MSIKILFVRISGTLDTTWGDEDPPVPLAAVDPARLVRDALSADSVWTPNLALGAGAVARLRPGASGLHPLGSLRLTQTAVPLGTQLQRIGASPVNAGDPVTVTVSAPGASTSAGQELFATAQFFDRSEEQKLCEPAFTAFAAGVLVDGAGWQSGPARSSVVVYEESLDEPMTPLRDRALIVADASLSAWISTGAVGRAHSSDGPLIAATSTTAGIKVMEERFVVIDAETATTIGESGSFGLFASALGARAVERVLVAEYEVAR